MIPLDDLITDRPGAYGIRRDIVTIPVIRVAVVLSVLVHIAVLWSLAPRLHLLPPKNSLLDEISDRLTVRLAPPPGPPPSLVIAPTKQRPAPAAEARRPKPTRPRPAAPVIALARPAPDSPASPPTAITPPAARPAITGDMTSYIEARRRARGEISPAASAGMASIVPQIEDEDARRKRIVAANLAGQGPMTFGYDPSQGGGMFQIEHIGYDDAEFLFFGWNKEIRRKTKQMIEVRKGGNSDIRLAVIRKMIAIIRSHEHGDFLWESHRLGRNVTLSARARDNAGLEDFMMSEFFPDTRLPQ